MTEAPPSQRVKTLLQTEGIPVPEGILLYALNPDGIFTGGVRGAIFESKLSRPVHPEFLNEVATYAIALERSIALQQEIKKDVDCAIVLHTDFPQGKHVTPEIFPIHDSNVNEVSRNIERFLRLVQISEAQRKEKSGLIHRLKQSLRGSPKTWKEFLVRPDGLPDADKRTFCPECRFRGTCYTEGGEPNGPSARITQNA